MESVSADNDVNLTSDITKFPLEALAVLTAIAVNLGYTDAEKEQTRKGYSDILSYLGIEIYRPYHRDALCSAYNMGYTQFQTHGT